MKISKKRSTKRRSRPRQSKRWHAFFSAITIAAQLLFIAGPAFPLAAARADEAPVVPTLTTDKADYSPEETVAVSGIEFDAYSTVLMKVTRPNDTVVTGDGTFTPWPTDYDTVSVDNGSFQYNYVLDGVVGTYQVEALNPADSSVVTSVTFTDASIGTYDQCSNDLGTGYTSGDIGCRWINGNLQHNNSVYFEGDATVQRLWLDGFVPGTNHMVTLQYGTTKAGKHAYDFLTTWNWSEGWVTDADRCQDITGCTSLADNTFTIPDDPNVTNTIETFVAGTRNLVMRGGSLTGITIPAIVSGTYAGDSETAITVSFTVPSSGSMCVTSHGSTTCGIALWFGAHVSKTSEWTAFDGTTGATSISGSPYHVALAAMDGSSIGNRDNQMQSGTILVPPTIETTSSTQASSVVPGTSVTDSVLVTGPSTVAGTVNFFLCQPATVTANGGDCSAGGSQVGATKTLSSGAATSDPTTNTTAIGKYCWRAEFTPTNSNYTAGSHTNSTTECFTTIKGSPTISTTPSAGGTIGTVLNDSATLSGGNSPTGSVTFNLFDPTDVTCAGTPTYTQTDPSAPYATSPGFVSNAVGTWHWKAHYDGDANNNPADSLCTDEAVTVGQGTSAVATTLHKADHTIVTVGSSVPLGTVMHDSATVTVSDGVAPTGSVDFRFYTSLAACTADTTFVGGTAMGSIALDGSNPGVAHPSTATAALTTGTYAFKAKWGGDTNYTGNSSSCENFTVNQGTSEVTTQLHKADESVVAVAGHVPLGTVLHDKATVTVSGSFVPTGSVTFTLYPSNNCTGQGTAMGTLALDGSNPGVAHPSTSTSALAAGDYSFKASWPGNTNYPLGDSSCENFTVDQAQLGVITNVHNAAHVDKTNSNVPLGSVLHDTATVTGGVEGFALPAVSFTLTSGYTGTCAAGTSVANNGTEGSTVKSADSSALGAGAYAYRAVVASSGNYIGTTGVCEPVTVDKAQLTVTTEVHDAGDTDITNDSVALGSIVHDTATVTGGVVGFTVPTPSFTLTSSYVDICANGSAVANNGTEGGATKSADSAALGAGEFAYRGSVAGNENYLGDDSPCEPFTVNKAQLTVTTEVHDWVHADQTGNNVPLGSIMHDTASVTGGVGGFATPTPTFTLTSSYVENCSQGSPVATLGTDELTGAAKSAESAALAAGAYAYRGSVAGNENYLGDDSICEPFTVDKAQLSVTTAVHDAADADKTNASVPLASIMHDTATVTGGVSGFATPTPTFTLTSGYVGTCAAGAVVTNNGTEGLADKSADSTALATGAYAYRGAVAGNDNYLGATGVCEPFTVDQGTSSVETTLHQADHAVVLEGGSVELGTVMHDLATVSVSPVLTAPTGNVDFRFYSTVAACTNDTDFTGGTTKGSIALDGATPGVAETSQDTGALGPGTYAFKAKWAGNGNYTGNTSACETFTVTQGTSTVTTELHKSDVGHTVVGVGTSVSAGTVMHDSATVTVTPGFAAPTGDVEFRFYSTAEACTQDTDLEEGALSLQPLDGATPGVAHPSADTAGLEAGNYAFKATWAGDTNYAGSTSDCENFTVVAARIALSPLEATNAINDPHDFVVTVEQDTGSGFVPVENAVVNLLVVPAPDGGLTQTDCHDGTNASGQCTATINSSIPGVFTAYARSTIMVNGVEFKLQTNGLGENSGPAVKTYVDVAVTTVIHQDGDESTNYDLNAVGNGGNLPLGSIVHDKATVTPSSGTAGGSVTYSFYENSNCSETPAHVETVTNGLESSNHGPLTAGDYSFKAHYNGDGPYPARAGACETLTISKGPTSLATELHENATEAAIALGGESITGNVHDKATVTGSPTFVDPTGDVTFRFYATQAACAADSNFSGGALKGAVPLVAGVAHPSNATGALTAGNYAFKAHWDGDDNYTGSTSNCEDFTVSTLTINKLANGGNDTFGYTVTGPTNTTPGVTTTGTPGTGTTTIVVKSGNYTVGETGLPTGWKLVGLTCAGNPVELGPTSSAFNVPAGTNQTCAFENTKGGATRTQGFWATHTVFTNSSWATVVAAGQNTLCSKTITATTSTGTNRLMGGFWASIPKTSNGLTNRSSLDKARMGLLQQLEASLLNRYALGTADGGAIATAKSAYCGTNVSAINASTSALGTFNQSGDLIPLGSSTTATPQQSKAQADIPFWNTTS